ncbi:hypothetical protein L1049_025816 [Liquidambar formosana]|uniref:peptidylprolyl isomerase n=1 Tax=Liquidambar formosana TaxID=63359 RepID=A0AAP0R6P6_LIQFO
MEAEKGTNVSDIADDEEIDEEEPGEVVESAPPQKVGEERVLNRTSGLQKKLLKRGIGWECPEFGDEVTSQVVSGLDDGIITMKKGEIALFTLPPELGHGGGAGRDGIPPDSIIQFEVELISWITVVDISKDGGIIKKILGKGDCNEQPGDLDEVLVKYQAMLVDGTIVAKTPEEGTEFYVKDGHFCPALPKAIKTMKRGEKEKAPWQVSNHEKIEAAGRKKEEGNILFKGGKYQRARKKYDKAADYVSEDGSFGDNDQKLIKALRVSCWLNSAACSLKINDFSGAIELCSKAFNLNQVILSCQCILGSCA